jgi:hypothetical protein
MLFEANALPKSKSAAKSANAAFTNPFCMPNHHPFFLIGFFDVFL